MSDWADLHLGMACYKKMNQFTGQTECLCVIGLFTRGFQRFLVAQYYQRRQLRQSALGISDFSNNKHNLFEAQTVYKKKVKPQLGMNLSNLDRTLTNEMKLLKQSIQLSERLEDDEDAECIDFDEFT